MSKNDAIDKIKNLDPEYHGALIKLLITESKEPEVKTSGLLENERSEEFLSGMFNEVIDRLNSRYDLGVAEYVREKHPDLYKGTQAAFNSLDKYWSEVIKGNVSVKVFKIVLMKWENYVIRCCNLFTQGIKQ